MKCVVIDTGILAHLSQIPNDDRDTARSPKIIAYLLGNLTGVVSTLCNMRASRYDTNLILTDWFVHHRQYGDAALGEVLDIGLDAIGNEPKLHHAAKMLAAALQFLREESLASGLEGSRLNCAEVGSGQ